jgi:hypothetical protein
MWIKYEKQIKELLIPQMKIMHNQKNIDAQTAAEKCDPWEVLMNSIVSIVFNKFVGDQNGWCRLA